MKENKNETGEELLDIDEKGNTIEFLFIYFVNYSFCSYISINLFDLQ